MGASPTPPGRRRLSIPTRWQDPLAVGAALLGMAWLLVSLVTLRTSAGWGYDFAAYYDAAVRLIGTGTPYQAVTLAGPFSPGPGGLYLYSPVLAVLLMPATQLQFADANVVFQLVRVTLLVLTCALIPASRRIRLVTFAVAALTTPTIEDLNLGNVSIIVTFLAVVAWRFLDRPLSGLAIAATLALRPTMAVVCAWWLLRGRLSPLLWSLGGFAGLVVLTLPFVGVTGWFDYLHVLRNLTGITGVPSNVDVGSFFLNIGAPPAIATTALVAGYAVAAGAVLLSLRRDRELGYVVTVVASLLLSPLLWNHYLTHLIIPAAFLAKRGRPLALALPLLTWLPEPLLGFVAVAALLLPFAAPGRDDRADTGHAWSARLWDLKRRPSLAVRTREGAPLESGSATAQ